MDISVFGCEVSLKNDNDGLSVRDEQVGKSFLAGCVLDRKSPPACRWRCGAQQQGWIIQKHR